VSITPNTSQVDVRSLVENGSIRSEMYKRRDSEQEMVGSPTQMGSPHREDSLNYKLPPGDDYSFSDCIISSPETKSASKISERASPNLRPYRVVNSRSTRSGPVTCRQRRGPRKVQQHVRFLSIFLFYTHTHTHTHLYIILIHIFFSCLSQVPGSNDDDRVGNLPTITEQSRKKRKKGTFSRIISTIFCC